MENFPLASFPVFIRFPIFLSFYLFVLLFFLRSPSCSILFVSTYKFVSQLAGLHTSQLFSVTEGNTIQMEKRRHTTPPPSDSAVLGAAAISRREDKPHPESQGSLHPPPLPPPHSPCRRHRRSVSMTTGELRAKARHPKMTHRI